jgi:alanine racemase
MVTFSDIIHCTQGKVLQQKENLPLYYLLTDSRKMIVASASLFFAIRGERYDGHLFIQEVYDKGVRHFIVEKEYHKIVLDIPDANLIEVLNSVHALQAVAAFHRARFSLPVVAVTGSNGKTITKEWMATLLGKQYNVVKSPKSYNSQVGVPLSVWQINETHNFAVFEAGISKPGEMIHLAQVIQPSIGVFTNIGTAHSENFESQLQQIQEKALLFRNTQLIIYCKDHTAIDAYLQTCLQPGQQTFIWAKTDIQATVRLLHTLIDGVHAWISVSFQGTVHKFSVPFIDEASIENIMHCITLMFFLETDDAEIQRRLHLLQPVSMRLELKQGINGCYLIDDTYNNDLAGLTIALDFLNLQKQRISRTLILSDLLESGMPEQELYAYISRLITNKGISRLIGIGEVLSRNSHYFQLPAQFFQNTETFLKQIEGSFNQQLILIKGARAFHFERIVQKLQQKTHRTILEINLDALAHNLNIYRSKLTSQTKIMVMVKAFAYGSGSAEVANFLQFHKIDYLAVAYADEGVVLRENGIHLPIMVMNPDPESFTTLLAYKLEPELYNVSIFREFSAFLEANNEYSGVHLKIDTGMHRLGFEIKDLTQLTQLLQDSKNITVSSILSHLAAADEKRFDAFTQEQIHSFNHITQIISTTLGYMPVRHILNSAGIERFPEHQLDMVRLGIGLYGIEASQQAQKVLETVGTLKTTISQIKYIPAGETVGYGRRGKIERDTRIATIAVGYADGYDRRLGNGVGKVWINGQLVPVIGNICMDMCMVDITDVKAQEGDEVIIFGKECSIAEMADKIGTIPYEILTGISERVKRIFYTS